MAINELEPATMVITRQQQQQQRPRNKRNAPADQNQMTHAMKHQFYHVSKNKQSEQKSQKAFQETTVGCQQCPPLAYQVQTTTQLTNTLPDQQDYQTCKKARNTRGESMFQIDNLTSLERQCHGGAHETKQVYDVEQLHYFAVRLELMKRKATHYVEERLIEDDFESEKPAREQSYCENEVDSVLV